MSLLVKFSTSIRFDTKFGAYLFASKTALSLTSELLTLPCKTMPSFALCSSIFSLGRISLSRFRNSLKSVETLICTLEIQFPFLSIKVNVVVHASFPNT